MSLDNREVVIHSGKWENTYEHNDLRRLDKRLNPNRQRANQEHSRKAKKSIGNKWPRRDLTTSTSACPQLFTPMRAQSPRNMNKIPLPIIYFHNSLPLFSLPVAIYLFIYLFLSPSAIIFSLLEGNRKSHVFASTLSMLYLGSEMLVKRLFIWGRLNGIACLSFYLMKIASWMWLKTTKMNFRSRIRLI